MAKTGTRKSGKSRGVTRKKHAAPPPYGNRPPWTNEDGQITATGRNLQSRSRRIYRTFPLGSFNSRRAGLGYYKEIGATPDLEYISTMPIGASTIPSPPRMSRRGCKGWFCGWLDYLRRK
jgi:hypothetical protein